MDEGALLPAVTLPKAVVVHAVIPFLLLLQFGLPDNRQAALHCATGNVSGGQGSAEAAGKGLSWPISHSSTLSCPGAQLGVKVRCGGGLEELVCRNSVEVPTDPALLLGLLRGTLSVTWRRVPYPTLQQRPGGADPAPPPGVCSSAGRCWGTPSCIVLHYLVPRPDHSVWGVVGRTLPG